MLIALVAIRPRASISRGLNAAPNMPPANLLIPEDALPQARGGGRVEPSSFRRLHMAPRHSPDRQLVKEYTLPAAHRGAPLGGVGTSPEYVVGPSRGSSGRQLVTMY
eukprot:GHUV01030968.1.p2 GENE.GHUV01030968.1~~GHUV01030968.1.p2  ORF type:complete len:107 (+),score=12.75 GHUV01030968.1:337-657(+)